MNESGLVEKKTLVFIKWIVLFTLSLRWFQPKTAHHLMPATGGRDIMNTEI